MKSRIYLKNFRVLTELCLYICYFIFRSQFGTVTEYVLFNLDPITDLKQAGKKPVPNAGTKPGLGRGCSRMLGTGNFQIFLENIRCPGNAIRERRPLKSLQPHQDRIANISFGQINLIIAGKMFSLEIED